MKILFVMLLLVSLLAGIGALGCLGWLLMPSWYRFMRHPEIALYIVAGVVLCFGALNKAMGINLPAKQPRKIIKLW